MVYTFENVVPRTSQKKHYRSIYLIALATGLISREVYFKIYLCLDLLCGSTSSDLRS